MIQFIKNILGFRPSTDFSELVVNGALILDVRTPAEYKSGHIKGSKNIAVQELANRLNTLKKNRIIITCCASGMRSATAKNILQTNGFREVYNGGGWTKLERKINR